MINEKWTKKIRKWLEDGNAKSQDMEALPWNVKVNSDEFFDYITSEHPMVLFSYTVRIDKKFATISLDTGITTDMLSTDSRMSHYRRLLIINKKYTMLKTLLHGDEDEVVIESNLDLSSLSETEFDNALRNILFASYDVVKAFNLGDSAIKELEARIPRAIEDMIAKGAQSPEILSFLTAKVGMGEAEAKKLVKAAEAHHSVKKKPDNRQQHPMYG